ncbi:MAG: RNA polymerase sigma factor (sigma-70 family) [Bacteroidia bacterium]|jgi:RNA polymerase sigma factor (sigma-70 family)
MTEKDIVQGCIADDRRCQNTLYNNYFPLMSSVAIRYYQNKDDALQAINYGFLKVLKNVSSYNETYTLATWIRNILVNHIIDDFRKNAKYNDHMHITDYVEDNDKLSTNLAEAKWDEEELRHMLQALPVTTRNVFNLYAIDGFKHREISTMIGISEGTSKWHVSEARKKLKKLLHKQLQSNEITISNVE